jgi:two-component system sensor histidine kinase GlrK
MRSLTIFKRLGLGYLAILLVVIVLGVYVTLKLGQLNQIIRSINSIDGETVRLADSSRDVALTLRGLEKKYVVSGDVDFYHRFLETEKYIKEYLERINALVDTPEKERLIDDVKELHSQYLSLVQIEVNLIKSREDYPHEEYQERKEYLISRIIGDLEGITKAAKEDVNRKIETSEVIGSRAFKVVAVMNMVAVAMAILIAFFNARTINRPIRLLIKGTRKISKGLFDEHLEIPSPPEIKELADAFNLMCDRLKEIDEMKADIVSHISHELRTPLAVIREAVGMLLLDGASRLSVEKKRKLLGIIDEECERLINSVNGILDFSRMDAGMIDYHTEKHLLLPLIEGSALKFRTIAERKGINIEVDLDDRLPPVNIDGERVGQVIDNLLGNALKFTPEGGRVAVSAFLKNGNMPGNFSDKGKSLIEVSVSDTGCGIPKEGIVEIFDKFKKLDGGDQGTGLGLYIARSIVNAHGGDIWVESEQGKGSSFFFTLPVS